MSVSTLPRTADLAFEEALDAMGGDSELLREIIEIFLETGSDQFRQLERAMAEDDLEMLETVAHGLKGSAASIGALGFSVTARELEFLARAGGGDRVSGLLTRLREQFALLEAACMEIDWDSLPRFDF